MLFPNTFCLKVGFNLHDAGSGSVGQGYRHKENTHGPNEIDIHISAFAWL
jgi:hypothetical protein